MVWFCRKIYYHPVCLYLLLLNLRKLKAPKKGDQKGCQFKKNGAIYPIYSLI